MQTGEQINCPHCGNDAFAKKKTLMDGWTNLGEILACSACDAKVADLDESQPDDDRKSFAKSALSDFLGVKEEEKIKRLDVSEAEKHFCRDCGHCIEHPFLIRCLLFNKKVNPMDDCPEFKKKETGDQDDG